MNKIEFVQIELAKNEAKFGRWMSYKKVDSARKSSLFWEKPPKNEIECVQYGNALADLGNYPVGASECFYVGIAGGCGPDCFVLKKGECPSPLEPEDKADEI